MGWLSCDNPRKDYCILNLVGRLQQDSVVPESNIHCPDLRLKCRNSQDYAIAGNITGRCLSQSIVSCAQEGEATMNKAGRMTRREFVKGSGAAGLVIGAGGTALLEPAYSMPQQVSGGKTVREAARDVKVIREADVVVVGGGPGGVGAAVSAARAGADTVLLERYGYLGGMGTGGLVTILPNMSDINGKMNIAGLCKEWVDRLDAREAADYPKKEHWGSDDKKLIKYYQDRSFFYVRMNRVICAVHIDAEVSKCILNDMVNEAGVKTYMHALGTQPIMEGNKVKGVIFESKAGRQAILAKVVIDSTGDGDFLPYTGAKFETQIDPKMRISALAMCFWVANVDLKKVNEFKETQPAKWSEQNKEIMKLGGQSGFITPNIKNQDSLVWFHNRYPNKSQIDIEELTRVEMEGRKKMLITHDYRKKYTPGFENSFIVLTCPELGCRGSRRMVGDYVLTAKDMAIDRPFPDTIAIFPNVDKNETSEKYFNMYIPYRALIPANVDNMLVACRAFSSDQTFQEYFNLIPHCMAFGQAAGTAAALSVKSSVDIRKVNIGALQDSLSKQGVPLPDRA